MKQEAKHSMVFLQQLRRNRLECLEEIKTLKKQLRNVDAEIAIERERLGVCNIEIKRRATLEHGIALFNDNPRKGISFLKESNYFNDQGTAPIEDIASLLHTANFSKAAIGSYLGDYREENLQVGCRR